jgi:cobalt-zinc-cadmium efflux system outer membrane protein
MLRSTFLLLLLINFGHCKSQDSLSLDIGRLDSLFLKNNLLLLASNYDIKASEALIIQAKAYPNPQFNLDLNAIDNQNNRYFHTGASGQKAVSLDQLIRVGGKRRSEIELAKGNAQLANLSFQDLLRNLRFQLHGSFFRLNQQNSLLHKYERQLVILDTLIYTYNRQAEKGNIPMKDVVRLKTVYLKLNNNRSEVARQAAQELAQLQMLLQTDAIIIPKINETYYSSINQTKPIDELVTIAEKIRPDLLFRQEEINLQSIQLKLQRQNVIPDLHVIGSYDQRGGAFTNQVNLGVGVPLPIWDRNRGNIRAASARFESSKLLSDQKQLEVKTEVLSAWKMMQLSILEYTKVNKLYSDDFEEVIKGVNDNFQKKNITILEFVDFFEAYNDSQAEIERIRTQLALSAININYTTASSVY